MQLSKLAISMLSIASAFIPIKQLSTLSYSRSAIKARNNIKMNSNKLITISPGGLLGFYMFGVSKYVKDNYKLDNSYLYSGASAGSWNSLFMTFTGNNDEFIDIILKNTPKNKG